MSSVHPSNNYWAPAWPEEFTKPRVYNKGEENITYLQWLNDYSITYKACDINDYSSDEENELSPSTSIDWSSPTHRETHYSKVKDFMSDHADFVPLSHDQVDQVVKFCRRATAKKSRYKEGKATALLSDSSYIDYTTPGKQRSSLYLGPLTPDQLINELSKPRFAVNPSHINNKLDNEIIDTNRRLIICHFCAVDSTADLCSFISGLSRRTIEALATTATRTQAPAVRDMFYSHLTSKISMKVTIPARGFRTFTLNFNIAYFALRHHRTIRKDCREHNKGVPLRNSFKLEFPQSQEGQQDTRSTMPCLYESHLSFTVTGIHQTFWTAYCFVDSYFDNRDTVDTYCKLRSNGKTSMPWGDPMSAGTLNQSYPILDPRRYFLQIVDIRLRIITQEWNKIVDTLERSVEQSKGRSGSLSQELAENARNITPWALQMAQYLRALQRPLGNSIDALDQFRKADLGFFESDDDSSHIKALVHGIEHSISDMKSILRRFECIENELRQDCTGSFLTQVDAFAPQRDRTMDDTIIKNIHILTIITLITGPLTVVSSIFSLDKALIPFSVTPERFTVILTLLEIFVSLPLATYVMWGTVFRPLLLPVHGYIKRNTQLQKSCNKNTELSKRFAKERKNSVVGGASTKQYAPGPSSDYLLSHANVAHGNIPRRLRHPRVSQAQGSIFRWIPFPPFQSITNLLERWVRPAPKEDKRRIEWICNCGSELYFDACTDSLEVHRLAAALNCNKDPDSDGQESYGMNTISSTESASSVVEIGSIGGTGSLESSQTLNKSTTGSTSATFVSVEPHSFPCGPRLTQERSYLELCVNTGQHTKILVEIDLTNIASDGDLFTEIRREYYKRRKFRFNRWLLKPAGIHFVKFTVQCGGRVGILRENLSLPPLEYVTSRKYAYSPCPLKDPPIPSHLFLHYLTCIAPEMGRNWLQRLPKKLEPSVYNVLNDTGLVDDVWGIHIVEGPNWVVVGFLNIFLLSLSGLAAGLWSRYTDDFQGAFGFAGWIVAVVNAVLLVYIAKWSRG